MMIASETKERYLADYRQAASHSAKRDPTWLRALRDAGLASFATLGFPSQKNEDWKYTSVEPIAAQHFSRANGEATRVGVSDFIAPSMIDPAAPRLVFINGRYQPELSQSGPLARGVVLTSLGEVIPSAGATAELTRVSSPVHSRARAPQRGRR